MVASSLSVVRMCEVVGSVASAVFCMVVVRSSVVVEVVVVVVAVVGSNVVLVVVGSDLSQSSDVSM